MEDGKLSWLSNAGIESVIPLLEVSERWVFVDVTFGSLVPENDECMTPSVLDDEAKVPCSPKPVLGT